MQTPDRPSQGCTEPHASATRSAVQSRQPSGGLFQQTMQQRTIDKLRKKLTKERKSKRRSKIQGKLKLSQEQSLQLQEALNAANKENERLETAREAQSVNQGNAVNTTCKLLRCPPSTERATQTTQSRSQHRSWRRERRTVVGSPSNFASKLAHVVGVAFR